MAAGRPPAALALPPQVVETGDRDNVAEAVDVAEAADVAGAADVAEGNGEEDEENITPTR